jgi:hypothetical protein
MCRAEVMLLLSFSSVFLKFTKLIEKANCIKIINSYIKFY